MKISLSGSSKPLKKSDIQAQLKKRSLELSEHQSALEKFTPMRGSPQGKLRRWTALGGQLTTSNKYKKTYLILYPHLTAPAGKEGVNIQAVMWFVFGVGILLVWMHWLNSTMMGFDRGMITPEPTGVLMESDGVQNGNYRFTPLSPIGGNILGSRVVTAQSRLLATPSASPSPAFAVTPSSTPTITSQRWLSPTANSTGTVQAVTYVHHLTATARAHYYETQRGSAQESYRCYYICDLLTATARAGG